MSQKRTHEAEMVAKMKSRNVEVVLKAYSLIQSSRIKNSLAK